MQPLNGSRPLYIKVTCVLLSLIAIGFLAILGKEILSPLLFASLIAILLLPVAGFLERKCRLPRGVAAIIAVLLFLLCLVILFYILGGQGSVLVDEWPQFKLQLDASVKQLQHWVSATAHITKREQLAYFNNATSRLMESGTEMLGSTLLSLSSMIVFLLFTIIYTIFFLQYRSLIMKFFITLFSEEKMAMVHEIAEEIQMIIRQYIIGLMIEMAAVSTTLCIAFAVLGVPYAILLGLLGGLLNLIPYIGIFITLIISTLITLASAAGAAKVVIVVIILVGTHLVDANVLFPLIVGSKVRINPMAMIAGVVVGGLIWSVAGMFLSIPVMAVLKIIFDKVDSLQPWGVLLGHSDKPKPVSIPKKKKNLP